MAFGLKPAAVVFWDLLDGTGNKAQARLHIPVTTTAIAALSAASTTAPLMQALTGCTIQSFGVSYVENDVTAANPSADSRVENKGVFSFLAANGLISSIQVPGIKEAMLTASGSINVIELDVVAFFTDVIGGLYCTNTGSDLTLLRAAYQRFRRSSKNMLPSDRLT